jgi:FMN reductase
MTSTTDQSTVRRTGLVALVGNPRPGSRTAGLAGAVLDAVAGLDVVAGPPDLRSVLDLADLGTTLGQPLGADSRQRWAGPLETVVTARLLVVATPTYKGSYTGLLKAFLDHVGAGELRGAIAVPVQTVGSPAHSLAADVHLRPLLLELGASTPTSALVVGESSLADPSLVIADWLDDNAAALRAALAGAPAAAVTA